MNPNVDELFTDSSKSQNFPVEKQNQPTNPISTNYGFDFSKASQDYWYKQGENYFKNYTAGKILGTVKKENTSLSVFLGTLSSILREAFRKEIMRSNKETSEKYKQQFQILESVLLLLAQNVDKNVDSKNIISFVHGWINSFIESSNETKM